MGFLGGTSGKEPSSQYKRPKRWGFDSWVGKIPWRRAWQPSILAWRIPMGRGAWQATVHGATKSWTRLKWLTHAHAQIPPHLASSPPLGLNSDNPSQKGLPSLSIQAKSTPSPSPWSGLLFPSPGDLYNPWMEPASPAWQADSLPLSHGLDTRASQYLSWPAACLLLIHFFIFLFFFISFFISRPHLSTHSLRAVIVLFAPLNEWINRIRIN